MGLKAKKVEHRKILVMRALFTSENGEPFWVDNYGLGEPVCWTDSWDQALAKADELSQEQFLKECETIYEYGSLEDLMDSGLSEAEFAEMFKDVLLSINPLSFNPDGNKRTLLEAYDCLYLPFYVTMPVPHIDRFDSIKNEV